MGNNQNEDQKKDSENTDAWKKVKDSGRLPTEDDLDDAPSSEDSSDD